MSNYKNKQKRAKDGKRLVRFDEIQGISMEFWGKDKEMVGCCCKFAE